MSIIEYSWRNIHINKYKIHVFIHFENWDMEIQNEHLENQSSPHQALLEPCHHHPHHLQKYWIYINKKSFLKKKNNYWTFISLHILLTNMRTWTSTLFIGINPSSYRRFSNSSTSSSPSSSSSTIQKSVSSMHT